ncbi:MAG TPA: DUF3995 domain-containing protein [Geothrix sp.]|nr:DUF3995 domain-containing protein [Geothrix sp.]
MFSLLAFTLMITFTGLGLLHLYWLGGGRRGLGLALPERQSRPLFSPSKGATGLVALALFGFAALVGALTGRRPMPLPQGVLRPLGYALAAVFLLRAVGDFRWVGFFKRERQSRFAALDTRAYSPLCLGLALGVLWILTHRPR